MGASSSIIRGWNPSGKGSRNSAKIRPFSRFLGYPLLLRCPGWPRSDLCLDGKDADGRAYSPFSRNLPSPSSLLMKLADGAEAFYRWVERLFRKTPGNSQSLSANLLLANRSQLNSAIHRCYRPLPAESPLPPVPPLAALSVSTFWERVTIGPGL